MITHKTCCGSFLRTLTIFAALIGVSLVNADVAESAARGLSDPNRILSRHRRFFLPSSKGWTLNTLFTLTVPFQDIGSNFQVLLPFTYAFDTGTTVGRRRSLEYNEETRYATLHKLESYLYRFGGGITSGFDAHACILRAICEAAETPNHADGILGQMINAMLMPAHLLEGFPAFGEIDYLTAQRRGQIEGDCAVYRSKCHMSLFKIEEGGDFYEDESFYDNSTLLNQV